MTKRYWNHSLDNQVGQVNLKTVPYFLKKQPDISILTFSWTLNLLYIVFWWVWPQRVSARVWSLEQNLRRMRSPDTRNIWIHARVFQKSLPIADQLPLAPWIRRKDHFANAPDSSLSSIAHKYNHREDLALSNVPVTNWEIDVQDLNCNNFIWNCIAM